MYNNNIVNSYFKSMHVCIYNYMHIPGMLSCLAAPTGTFEARAWSLRTRVYAYYTLFFLFLFIYLFFTMCEN